MPDYELAKDIIIIIDPKDFTIIKDKERKFYLMYQINELRYMILHFIWMGKKISIRGNIFSCLPILL